MNDLKKPLTYEKQLEQLKKHGMVIEDEAQSLDILKNINYYRFTGYALHRRIDPNVSEYISGTSFNNIYRTYCFDQSLRDILRKYIEIIEIYFRTQISYGFSLAKCVSAPHNQHYDRNNFYNKIGYDEVMAGFKKEKRYYYDSLIMRHHNKVYGGRLPMWAMVEMLSFSNLSKLYSSMYLSEQISIAASTGTGGEDFEEQPSLSVRLEK